MNMTTFADIQVNKFFYMDIGGMNNVRCQKLSDTRCGCRKLSGEWMEMDARPGWEVKSAETRNQEVRELMSFEEQRQLAGRVNGHSSSYPWGEH